MHAAEQDRARLTWAREVIGRQLKQLIRLVDDLLDVSRITRGKIELKIESIDVARVIAAAVETSRPYVDALEHVLVVSTPAEPLWLKGDFVRVAQILANLINNAAKYTNKGGRIAVSACREGTEIVFRVRDSGAGIPPEFWKKFERGDVNKDGVLEGDEIDKAFLDPSNQGGMSPRRPHHLERRPPHVHARPRLRRERRARRVSHARPGLGRLDLDDRRQRPRRHR